MRSFYTLILLALLSGCSTDEFRPVYDVPDDIQPFVEAFVQEAANRGRTIAVTNLIIKYDKTLALPYCGQCNSNAIDADIQKIITINPDLECWFSPEEHEAFYFHELGHCILGRLHDNRTLPNGDPKSLMVESNLGVYAPCLYPIDETPCNNLGRRPYYIDELFDENTPVPDWGM